MRGCKEVGSMCASPRGLFLGLEMVFLCFIIHFMSFFRIYLWHLQCPVEGNSLFDSGKRKCGSLFTFEFAFANLILVVLRGDMILVLDHVCEVRIVFCHAYNFTFPYM